MNHFLQNGAGPRESRFLFDLAPTQLQLECCPGTEPQCTCGVERPNRIVGGADVRVIFINKSTGAGTLHFLQRGKYPWVAAVSFSLLTPGLCGATLIASRWAMTAAHCASGGDIRAIGLGEHDISGIDALDTKRYVNLYSNCIIYNYD